MKKRFLVFFTLTGFIFLLMSFRQQSVPAIQQLLTGAWHLRHATIEEVLIFQDGYFSHTVFDKSNKKFISSYGGVYKPGANALQLNIEFDTRTKEDVGKEKTVAYAIAENLLATDITGMQQKWTRLDNGKDNLAGVWRITGRMVDGKINQMQRGDRKTLKLLSGTRFQWMAINPATKEFFGTGGGTYTFTNGKYTENIEFFSRDSTRIGASLTFDGSVKDGVWNHSGKSSKGDPLNELWTKEKY
ncbi:MAG TPA: hypothetical protein VJ111_14720 [Chitinophagaceae bacterium]|nr:hypothetical protein [Chitinophagaceae bacterium]